MGVSIAAFLDDVRLGLSKYADVFIEFGAEEKEDFSLLRYEDLDEIENRLKDRHAPPPLHVRAIMNALHNVLPPQPEARTKASTGEEMPPAGKRMRPEQPDTENDDEDDLGHLEREDPDYVDADSDGENHNDFNEEENSCPGRRPSCGNKVAKCYRSRESKAKRDARASAMMNGTGHTFARVREKSLSKNNRHGVFGQQRVDAAFGRLIQSRHLPPSSSRHVCTVDASGQPSQEGMIAACGLGITKLLEGAQHCMHTTQRLHKEGRSTARRRYHFVKLREYLLANAFDFAGRPRVHLDCLQLAFDLSHNTTTRYHRLAMHQAKEGSVSLVTKREFMSWNMPLDTIAKPPDASATFNRELYLASLPDDAHISILGALQTRKLSKSDFLADSSLSELDILPPDDVILSNKQYLASLDPSAMVTVVVQLMAHGLTGRPSNRCLPSREAFRKYVTLHRQPTGRTLQSDSRYHGAEFYLDAQFLAIKQQTGAKRALRPVMNVLSSSFAVAFISMHPGEKAPSDTTVYEWFKADFRKGSVHGHTTLFPPKTDACAFCEMVNNDISSLEASLRKHKLHVEDAGSIERQKSIRDLNDEVEQLQEQLKQHRLEAAEAQKLHKERVATSYSEYLKHCESFMHLLEAASSGDGISGDQLKEFARDAARCRFSLDSDYQQDKSYPHWGKSPQPGPTYFMSKVTAYVHLLVSHSCGRTTGPTRLRRNVGYFREQQCAGSKDCNDTVFTIFDYLANRPPQCQQPPVVRTGFERTKDNCNAAPATLAPPSQLQTLADEVASLTPVATVNFKSTDLILATQEVLETVDYILGSSSRGQQEPEGSSSCAGVSTRTILDSVGMHSRTNKQSNPCTEEERSAAELAKWHAISRIQMHDLQSAAAVVAMSLRPQSFVRVMVHSFDSCSGTNLSQFTSGGYALALAVGALDAWLQRMMVVGHTKFGPDILANKIANKYNTSDVWNGGHLLEHASAYCEATWYDESLLTDLHEFDLFSPIPGISSFRSIMLVADDGGLDTLLGPPAQGPEEAYKGAKAESKYYLADKLHDVINMVAEASLVSTMAQIAVNGAGASGINSGVAFLPKRVVSVRTVRCFVQPKEEDLFCFEIPGYSKFSRDAAGVSAVNEALACDVRPAPKEYYGMKLKHIKEMYQKFVPPEFVPDKYELPTGGSSGLVQMTDLLGCLRTPFPSATARAQQAAEQEVHGTPAQQDKAVGRRWNQALDDRKLRELTCDGTKLPNMPIQWRNLASQIFAGCEVAQVKSAVKKLYGDAVMSDTSRGGASDPTTTTSETPADGLAPAAPTPGLTPAPTPATATVTLTQAPAEADEYYVHKLHDARFNRRLELLVEWRGYPETHDYTWEPLAHLPNDKDCIAKFKADWIAMGKEWPSKSGK